MLLHFGIMLLVALILWPFFFCFLWFAVVIDNNDTTGAPDPSFWMLFLGAVIGSILLAFISVALHRLFAWLLGRFWKRRLIPSS